MPVIATTIVQSGAIIADTIAKVGDMKKRREFEQDLALLDKSQKERLSRELLTTDNTNKKIEILAKTLAEIKGKQFQTIVETKIGTKSKERTKKEMTTALIVVGGAALVLIAIVLYKRN